MKQAPVGKIENILLCISSLHKSKCKPPLKVYFCLIYSDSSYIKIYMGIRSNKMRQSIFCWFSKELSNNWGFLLYQFMRFDILSNCAKYLRNILYRNENMSKNDAKNVRSAMRFCDIKKKEDFFQRGALNRKSVSL
jgi:hypothetical protein